jgi:hypothetical protein
MAKYQLTTSSDAFRLPFRLQLQPVRPGQALAPTIAPVAEMVTLKRLDNGQLDVESGFSNYTLKVNGKEVNAYETNLAAGGTVTVQGTNVNWYPAPAVTVTFPRMVPREVIRPSGWVIDADSFEPGEGEPNHAIDGDPRTFWHTAYSASEPAYPHWLRVDLGDAQSVNAVEVTPRSGQSNGRFSQFRIEVSGNGSDWRTVARGAAKDSPDPMVVTFPSATTRWIRLVTEEEVSGRPWSSLAELRIFGPPRAADTP